MSTRLRQAMSLRFAVGVALVAALATFLLHLHQARTERERGLEDLERRSALLAHRVEPAARALVQDTANAPPDLEDRLEGHARLLGLAIADANGSIIAQGSLLEEYQDGVQAALARSLSDGRSHALVHATGMGDVHVLAMPLAGAEAQRAVGAIVVLHDAGYLSKRSTRTLLWGGAWALVVGGIIFAIVGTGAWALFERPMHRLSDWMRRLRVGGTIDAPPARLPVARLTDESTRLAASFRAARARELAHAQEATHNDRTWTQERLRSHALTALGNRALVVVSNREPYMHQLDEGKVRCLRPASGLVTGLEPVLRACGGLWVAHGSGSADRQSSDSGACVTVPPEDPRYTLRRVWLSRDEEQGYYYGFSNEGLWPLCHLTHERPIFRASDWAQYQRVNQRFADAVLEEVGEEDAVILVQDYQLALLPGLLKARRPALAVGLFWHIPWPNSEAFRICPYAQQIVRGMLSADLLGFHLQQHCNNFLDTVDRTVAARLDWDRFTASIDDHQAHVRPFPISVQPWSERTMPGQGALESAMREARARHGLGEVRIGVGVDRIDYTKGIAERFRAIDRLLERSPALKGAFSFVQLGAPSRTHIPRYRELVSELEAMADAINWKHAREGGAGESGDASEGWRPIHFLVDHHDQASVLTFLRMAEVCVVSSLHDGMNLVAKEYVAAQGMACTPDSALYPQTGTGVLVLSEFAGAARDLPEALIVNPYDTEQFARALQTALAMDLSERRARMTRLRERVEQYNVYRWAAEFITALAEASASNGPGQRSTPTATLP